MTQYTSSMTYCLQHCMDWLSSQYTTGGLFIEYIKAHSISAMDLQENPSNSRLLAPDMHHVLLCAGGTPCGRPRAGQPALHSIKRSRSGLSEGLTADSIRVQCCVVSDSCSGESASEVARPFLLPAAQLQLKPHHHAMSSSAASGAAVAPARHLEQFKPLQSAVQPAKAADVVEAGIDSRARYTSA